MVNKSTIVLDAKDKTGRAFASADAKMNKMLASTRALTSSFAVLAGGVALGSVINSSLKAGDEIQKLSIKLGGSTEALSQLKHVAGLSGVEFRTMTKGLQQMTRSISEAADGTGEAKTVLAELGLDAKKLNEIPLEEKFKVLADRLNGLGNEADKVRMAEKLFGARGAGLLQAMENGSEGIREMMREADLLGLTLSSTAANDMAAANDAITKMSGAASGFATQLTAKVAPAITTVIEGLSDLFDLQRNEDTLTENLILATEQMNKEKIALDNLSDSWFGTESAIKQAEERYISARELVMQLQTELDKLTNSVGENASAVDNQSDIYDDAIPSLDGYLESMRKESEILTMTAREKAIYTAEQKAMKAGYDENLPAIAAEAAALFDQRQALKDVAREAKELAERKKEAAREAAELKQAYIELDGQLQSMVGMDAFGGQLSDQEIRMADAKKAALELAETQKQLADSIRSDVMTATDKLTAEIIDLNGAYQRGDISAEVFRKRIAQLEAELQGMADSTEESGQAITLLQEGLTGIGESFTDSLFEAENFGDGVKRVLEDIAKAIVNSKINELLFGLFNLDYTGPKFSFGGDGLDLAGLGSKLPGFKELFGGGSTISGAGSAAAAVGTSGVGTASISSILGAQGSAATSGGGVAGGFGGAGTLAAPVALFGVGLALQNSRKARREKRRQEFFQNIGNESYFASDSPDKALEAIVNQSGGRVSEVFANDDKSKYFAQITGDAEAAKEAITQYTDEHRASHESQLEAFEEMLPKHLERGDVIEAVNQRQIELAGEFTDSMNMSSAEVNQLAATIASEFGSAQTDVKALAQSMSDGFLSASEIAAAGISGLAEGAISNLQSVENQANSAAQAVARLGNAGGINLGNVRPGEASAIQSGNSSSGRGFSKGGISRGPMSGYRPLLHGTEAIVPLGDGNEMKGPVIVKGGGQTDPVLMGKIDQTNKMIRRLAIATESANRRAA